MIWGVGFGDFSGIVSHLKTPENEGMSAEEGPSLGTILKGSRVVFQASIFRCENVSFREGGWTSTEKNHLVMAGWMRYLQVLVEHEQIMADGRQRARSNKKPGVF